MSFRAGNYRAELSILKQRIPEGQLHILRDPLCEYESDFLGFVDVYGPLSRAIPKDKIVVDLGCYLAAQSWLFSEHEAYIGVDFSDDYMPSERFSPPNATHYDCTIQDFIKNKLPSLLTEHKNSDFVAICSYVPDFSATDMAFEAFENAIVVYPGERTKERGLFLDGFSENLQRFRKKAHCVRCGSVKKRETVSH